MFAQNFVWVIMNLSEEYKKLDFDQTKQIMQILNYFMCQYQKLDNNDQILQDLVQGLANVASNSDQEYLELACSSDLVMKTMFELLRGKDESILKYVLIYIGGVLSSTNLIHTQKCLEYEGLDRLGNVLNS